MTRSPLSVVIPARDAARTLSRCLDALSRQEAAPEFEVVVVDNGSTDDTARIVEQHPVGARLVREPRPGSYAARNAGIVASTGSVLAFTDADCIPHSRWLAAGSVATPERGLVGGRIVTTGPPLSAVARYDSALYLDQSAYVSDQGFAATANLFVDRRVIEAAGLFDADLHSGGDLEFCHRAAEHGGRLVYSADAVVEHEARTSYHELWRLHRRLGSGWAALARRGKRPPFWRDPALRWPTFHLVVERVNATSPTMRRRQLAPVHATAMAARWTGRLTGR